MEVGMPMKPARRTTYPTHHIRLTRKATAALREHRKRQLEERMRLGTLWQDHDLVFPSGASTPLSGGNLNRAFKALLKRVGLSSMIRFHDLRHAPTPAGCKSQVRPRAVRAWRCEPHAQRLQ